MSSVTIPREIHERMVKKFRLEYEDEFGDMSQEKSFTRDELIDKYAADIQFWKKREPTIDVNRKPNMRTICSHAIATNAQSAMWRLCSEKGILSEVEAKIKDGHNLLKM